MEPKKDLNREIRSLTDFVEALSFEKQLSPGVFRDSTVLLSRGDRTIILVGDDADRYTEIKSSIYDALFARERPVSRRAVNGLIDDFFMRALASGDHTKNPGLGEQVRAEAQQLKTALFEKPQNWEVQLMVEGLAPSGLPMTVGEIQFQQLDGAGLSELKERTSERIRKLGPRDVDAVLAQMSGHLDILLGKTVATVSVSAVDEEAAIQAAKRELQITADAINLFTPRERMGGWVFLPGDTMPQRELILAYCENSKLTPSFRQAGPHRKIPLNQIATRPGFARISTLLRKESPTKLEDRILASVQWAGRAQVEPKREEAFMLFAIALESLLLGKDVKTDIAYRLAVRCAHLGGGPALDDKKRVIDQVQSLYDLRSRIVHSGSFVVSEEELTLISEYAVSTLMIVIDREPFRGMTEIKELETWFEAQLLAGGTSPT
ncbi:MAG TPA: hypothetical protein VK684_02680 [Edaphobacter sp.]|jgi:hypothetical protein|nr:hypothetical protein [Edaphobacter sp.]